MEAQATRRGVPAAVIWGGFGVLAWAALTALTGGGPAHADDRQDPLDGVTSLVAKTVSAVTAPVAPVVDEIVDPVVTDVVAPVVETVTAPVQKAAPAAVETVTETVAAVPVVGQVAAPVIDTVAEAVPTVVAPVTEALTDSPVAAVTEPLLDVVTDLPVVGRIVDEGGVTDLVDRVVGVVDGTTGIVGGVVEETLPPVLGGLSPTAPSTAYPPTTATDDPGRPAGQQATAAAHPMAAIATSGRDGAAPRLAVHPGLTPDEPQPTARAQSPSGAPSGSPPTSSAPLAPTSSAGPGGSSIITPARLDEHAVPPLAVGEPTTHASDATPASPVSDAAVSPD